MLEIISLIIITRLIGPLAEAKGLNSRRWKFKAIFLFLALEFLGYFFALLFFAPNNLVSIALVGFGFGITSYPLIKNYLLRMPDPITHDEENES